MRTKSVLTALLCCLPVLASGQPQDMSKVEIKATRVAGGVYLLQGEGGNIAAVPGPEGVVLVDDEFAPLAPKIEAALEALKVPNARVRFVINTHYHFDHTDGNPAFAERGATIIAHENVRTRMAAGGTAGTGGALKFDVKPAPSNALPIITFERDVAVHLNGEDIKALHYAAAHTDGDVVILFRAANVVHMGDIYVRYGFPFIDVLAGGSIDGLIRACESAIATLPADVKIIPGHGEVSSIAELRDYLQMLRETRAVVAAALQAGKTVEQMKAEGILDRWSARYSSEIISTAAFIETLDASLRNAGEQAFVPHN